jgi:hypothetical protein
MLTYKNNSVVIYFIYDGHEYRRIESQWEIRGELSWNFATNYTYLESIYQKRQRVFNLINEVDKLKKEVQCMAIDISAKYTNAVRELMAIFGVTVMIDYNKEKLIKLLNEGRINIALT